MSVQAGKSVVVVVIGCCSWDAGSSNRLGVKVHGRPRPDTAARVGDRLKLHRRELFLRGRPYTVVTLRLGTDARFSTNFHHGTWHILSDWHGARLLGRLLWGLAYQRRPGTLVLIDRPFLDPNPFDAEPADPIALVPASITPWTNKAARDLRRHLPLVSASAGTVRWRTHGLDAAVATRRADRDRPVGAWRAPWIPPRGFQERMDRIGGLVTLTASAAVLKEYATYIYTLGEYHQLGMAYAEVDWPNGEVQVFRDYRRRVSAARLARRQVLTEQPDRLAPDSLNPLIWQRGTAIRHQPRRRTGRSTVATPPQPSQRAGSAQPSPTTTPYGRTRPALADPQPAER
jgi:hypothetical protein